MRILGIAENVSWISNQDDEPLFILQRVLLRPDGKRRAAPQRCCCPSSRGCSSYGHNQPGLGWHWDRGPTECHFWSSVSLPEQCPSQCITGYRFAVRSDDWKQLLFFSQGPDVLSFKYGLCVELSFKIVVIWQITVVKYLFIKGLYF